MNAVQNLYFITTLASGAIAVALAVLLAGLRIRSSEGLAAYNKARWCLVTAIGAYGILSLAEIALTGTAGIQTGDLTACLIIVIGSLMAMFFTMMVLSFMRPELVRRRYVLVQLAIIVPLGALLLLAKVFLPQTAFRVIFVVMLAAYIALLVIYTRLYVRSYAQFKSQMLDFYEEEDLVDKLQWISRSFYLALAVGIAALFLLFNNLLVNSVITVLFTVCFLIIHIFFVNYHPYATMVDRAVSQNALKEQSETPSSAVIDTVLKEKVDAWIADKGYLDNTKPVEEVAYDMGVLYYPNLKEYIQQTTGEDFRTWRIRLRIQEAERILREHPEFPISMVATMAGFNDRAYFYRSFKKVTGKTVREFLETIQ